MRATAVMLGATALLCSTPAFAQDPPPSEPPQEAAPEATPTPTPATAQPASNAPARALAQQDAREQAANPTVGPRTEGMRLGLDLSFLRSTGEATDRVNAGSPSLLPLGADLSWHTSAKVLLGFHGHAALASRDDCLGDTDCTGRGYGLGTHIEAAFSATGSFIPYFRYGIGWEMVHQMGAYKNSEAYRYRHAFDLLDIRFGGDFILSRGEAGRTTRLGPFVGMIAGVSVDEVSSGRGSEAAAGAGHIWFSIGARGTTDW